jgi:ATP-dependent protease ClpP protease subunit
VKTIKLSGIIGNEITPQVINTLLDEAGGAEITIELDSVGGYLYEAFVIHNAISSYKGKKTLVLNGLVASAASYISTAFDLVVAKDNSVFMIHNAMNAIFGDYRALEKEADNLKRLNDVLADAYAKKSKRDRKAILAEMNEETYYYGKEIVEKGFADSLESSGAAENRSSDVAKAQAMVKSVSLPNKNEDARKACEYLNLINKKTESIPDEVFAEIRSSIADGEIDPGPWDEKDGDIQYFDSGKRYPWGKDGRVYQSALRITASRAGRAQRHDVSALAGEAIRLIQTQAKKNRSGGNNVETRDEAIQLLKNAITNEHLTYAEIATNLGFSDKLMTADHRSALEIVNKLTALGITDPVAFVGQLQADQKANEEKVRNAALDTAFGAVEENGKKNVLRAYAGQQLAAVSIKEIDAKIESFKKDDIALELAGKRADVYNSINVIEHSDKPPVDGVGKRRVDVV